MKYLPLVWAALGRRVPRTVLTGLSIAIAFLLYAMLSGVQAVFNQGDKIAAVDRLVSTGHSSFTQILPYSHANRIRQLPGISLVSVCNWFGGVYQKESNFFPQFAVEPEPYIAMYPELVMPEEQKQAWFKTRTGAIVSKSLADRYHWKIGDRIPLQAGVWPQTDGSNVWTFDLVGIFDAVNESDRAQYEMMLIRYDYFDEARMYGKGTSGWFLSRIEHPGQDGAMIKAIDALFENSRDATRTSTEKAFNKTFVKQMGDIGLVIGSIIGAVFFTLLFLTGNTMMQSVRERIPELAVLKTLGYTGPMLLALVLAESLLLTGVSALVGLGIATVLMPIIGAELPGMSGMNVTLHTLSGASGIALLLALAVGLPPAIRAMRIDIVNALYGH